MTAALSVTPPSPRALTARERTLALIVIAVVPAEVALCGWLAITRDLPQLAVATAFDATLLAGTVLFLVSRRNGGLRALGLSPLRLVRLVGVSLALAGLAARALGLGQIRQLFGVAALAEIAVLALIALGLGRGLQQIAPPWVVESVRAEVALFAAARRSLARRPLAVSDGAFTARKSRMGQLLVVLVVLSLAEAPALHLALHSAGWRTHLTLIALHLYSFAWLAGDWRMIQESGHRLGLTALEIRLGRRWRGALPYAQIVTATRITDPARHHTAIRVTPFDPANVELTLRQPATLESYFGIRKTSERVQLFVDDPERLLAELAGRS